MLPAIPELTSEATITRARHQFSLFYSGAHPDDAARFDNLAVLHSTFKKMLAVHGYFKEPEQRKEFELMRNALEQRYCAARSEVFKCASFQALSLQKQMRIAVRLFRVAM